MNRMVAGFVLLLMVVVFTAGCWEQKYPHGRQAKPDNVQEKH